MHQHYALGFVFFGLFVLAFFLVVSRRAAQRDKEWTGDPAALVEARKSRRAAFVGILVMSVGSWIIAGLIYTHQLDLGRLLYPRSVHFYLTTIVLLVGLTSSAFLEWKLHQFSKRLEAGGASESELAKEAETTRKVRVQFHGLWIFTFILVLVA